jgi:hypothetical protein
MTYSDLEFPLDARPVLGPVPCQGCGQAVTYVVVGEHHLGWLHDDGRFRCPALTAPAETKRPVLSGRMDHFLRLLGLWTTCG